MNLLKSKYHSLKWDNYDVVPMPISQLWASVPKAEKLRGKNFYEPVRDDIAKNGLRFPLIVVEATHAQLIKEKKRYKDRMLDLPFDPENTDLEERIYVIWGGSNRVRVASELGYDHVDCVIFPNGKFDLAKTKQSLHRKPFQKKFY